MKIIIECTPEEMAEMQIQGFGYCEALTALDIEFDLPDYDVEFRVKEQPQ